MKNCFEKKLKNSDFIKKEQKTEENIELDENKIKSYFQYNEIKKTDFEYALNRLEEFKKEDNRTQLKSLKEGLKNITNEVIEIKTVLEDIREQVQNIE